MLNMVQGLRIASAEAMQLNGQVRLVAESSFTSAEGGLVVDGELLPTLESVSGAVGVLGFTVAFEQRTTYLTAQRCH